MSQRSLRALVLGVLCVLLIGLVSVLIMKDRAEVMSASSSVKGSNSMEASQAYNNMKKMAEALEKKVAEDPKNIETRLSLANTYYDLGAQAPDGEDKQKVEYFNKAVSNYREVIKSKEDANILVDMATAAFYAEDDKTAEETFLNAVKKYPNSYEAHYNYGVFLLHSKGDYNGSLREWKAALQINPNAPNVDRLRQLISGIEAQLKESNNK